MTSQAYSEHTSNRTLIHPLQADMADVLCEVDVGEGNLPALVVARVEIRLVDGVSVVDEQRIC